MLVKEGRTQAGPCTSETLLSLLLEEGQCQDAHTEPFQLADALQRPGGKEAAPPPLPPKAPEERPQSSQGPPTPSRSPLSSQQPSNEPDNLLIQAMLASGLPTLIGGDLLLRESLPCTPESESPRQLPHRNSSPDPEEELSSGGWSQSPVWGQESDGSVTSTQPSMSSVSQSPGEDSGAPSGEEVGDGGEWGAEDRPTTGWVRDTEGRWEGEGSPVCLSFGDTSSGGDSPSLVGQHPDTSETSSTAEVFFTPPQSPIRPAQPPAPSTQRTVPEGPAFTAHPAGTGSCQVEDGMAEVYREIWRDLYFRANLFRRFLNMGRSTRPQ
ncbi:uncharacterized protein LOC142472419 [Ascaphus truei]|uniref:uncharacterized protein LOC142472419 n=1 Tax=Ascaphus truei TaxID=8439 RepID=UPI003F5908BF